MRTWLAILILALATGCAAPRPAPEGPSSSATDPHYSGLSQRSLGPYQATFLLHFQGEATWTYRTDTRFDGSTTEVLLHMEGLSRARNPGDVRVVTQGAVSRMHGPGTEGECVQFPSQLNLGPVYLTPDDLIPPDRLGSYLTRLNREQMAGRQSLHYILRQPQLESWQDLQIDLWLEEETGAVLRYDLRGRGPDPLFGTGEGLLSGWFMVTEIGPQRIEPVSGCEIEIPLPDDAVDLVKLPGLISFDSAAPTSALIEFYQAALARAGWEALSPPLSGGNATLMSYQRDQERLQIHIEQNARGVKVDLLIDDESVR